ncbi:MAG TPA: glycoside hydrolase family 3 N-terminal domain-containing protein [Acidimicrobiales bacterium]|nr:glycoside hydrolase family 3 N-terminal domain-containing protein [Acidimicrobiales bacterium]
MLRPLAGLALALGALAPPAGGSLGSRPAPAVSPAAALEAAAGGSVNCVAPPSSWPLADRLNQLLMVGGQFSDLSASAPEASAGVGGFVLFGQPPAGSGPSIRSGIAQLATDASSTGKVVPWMSTDEEGGPIARLSNVIGPLPSPRQMAAQWTPSQVGSTMASHGAAMRSLGITMDLAPVMDTASPSDTVAGENYRSFSQSPQTVAAYGNAYWAGLRQAGVVPVIKHFPGLGHANADTDTSPASTPPLSQLQSDDLIPFASAISAGAPVVMVGNMSVPGLTGGQPASLSPAAYSLLRQTYHFAGVALTDDLHAVAVSSAGYSQAQAATAAIEAGADMAMIDASGWPAAVTALTAAVQDGSLSLTRVDASVSRVLAAKGLQICSTVSMAAAPGGSGYWIAGNGGSVQAFGSAGSYGSPSGTRLNKPVVGMAATPDGKGYWLVASDGGIFSYGDAGFHGSTGSMHLNQPVVGMAATPDGKGYWMVASDGGIFSFGDAGFFGSTGSMHLNQPVVGMVPTPDGGGYWLVASDGGIFSFGDARFFGSTGSMHLNRPVVGMAATPDGKGYWMVASDGGIFTFGDAGFFGSTGSMHLNRPVVGMAPTSDGGGYWLVASDGGIFTFGDARFYGSGV